MIVSVVDEAEVHFPRAQVGEPTWPVALLFPRQGDWTEADYIGLDTNRLVELSEGCLEVLPVPTPLHQLMAQLLFKLLDAFVVSRNLGLVFMAPLAVRLWPGKIRQPDVLFLRPERLTVREGPASGADLVMEVVSEGAEDRNRDVVTKRLEYAQAGISEYWIIDPLAKRISLLTLHGKKYREHGEFAPGERAASQVLPGFEVDVASVFAVEDALPRELRQSARSKRTKRKRESDK